MNMQNGWVTLNREIQDHWIFKDPKTFQMWVILLMYVNWKDNKIDLGSKLVTCKRGQSYRSLRSWAELMKCGRTRLKTFLTKLQHDNMIVVKTIPLSNHSRTLVTITNYDSYQQSPNHNRTAGQHAGEPLAVPELIKSNKDNKKRDFKILEKTGLRQGKNKVFFDKDFIGRLGNNGQVFSGTQIYSFIMKHGQFWENEGELNKAIKRHIKASQGQDDHQPHVYANSVRKHRGGGSRLKDLLNFEEPNNVQGTN